MKRLSAFTMIELVVAMLISSIVISVVFYSFSLFSAQLTKRRLEAAKITDYVVFQRAFQRDIEKAASVRDSADGRLVMAMEGHSLVYSIGPKYILRDRDGVVDTFFLTARIVEKEYVSDSLLLIRHLQMNMVVGKDSLPLPVYKEYTARQLLQAENPGYEQ